MNFNRAYDAVLTKWPQKPLGVDLAGRFGSTHVNVCGREDSRPLILLSGGGATSTVWFDNVGALSKSRRVFAVDTLGDAGLSIPNGDRMKSVDDLIEWMDSIVDCTGADTVDVIGHSYGAMIALALALHRPNRVGKLVLLDPNSSFSGMKAGYLLRALPLLLKPSRARRRRLLEWETGELSIDSDWLSLAELGTSDLPRPNLVVPQRPSEQDTSALDVELLVVLARDGRVHDAATVAKVVRERVPAARVEVLEDASHHSIPMVPADELNRVLVDFLES
ncbi:alpha/beta fold hydrolase [Rhodococcus sp. NPDC056506]|uniref:alpha/beta fold hydrolase n=1 Tax=Rhodococcus sp. NPDC056506 TaxID=3345844 RepID=UPI0036718E13